MPPPDRPGKPVRSDVSVLRLFYTDAHFCKRHARSLGIPYQTYKGLAAIYASAVSMATRLVQTSDSRTGSFWVKVRASPLDDQQPPQEIAVTLPVTTTDAGLPMHADILYSEPMEKGKPSLAMQKVALHLARGAAYLIDPDVGSDHWNGGDLKPTEPSAE